MYKLGSRLITSIALIVIGALVFFTTGGFYSDFGFIALVCVAVGIIGFFKPSVTEKFLKVKTKGNLVALIFLVIVSIPIIIYIWNNV